MTEVTPNYKLPLVDFDKRGWQNLYYKAMRTLDAGMTSIMSVADFVGVWENATDYTVGNKVVDGVTCIIYECLVNHTSANAPDTFADDRTAHTTYWSSWSLPARGRGAWNGSTVYAVGDFVSDSSSGRVAICTVAHTSTSFQTDIDAGYWDVLATLTTNSLGSATPQGIAASSGNAGVATAASREDHVHAHGNLAGGTLHADASGAAAGFLSAAKFTEIGTATSNISTLTTNLATLDSNAVKDGDSAGGGLTGTYPNPTLAANAVTTTAITDANVTNAKLADMAQSTIKGRASGAGTGVPTDLSATQATALLNALVGDSGSGGTKGLVPAPSSGDAAAGKFLKADATWATPTGTGSLINIQILKTGTTYTRGTGCTRALVVARGGGGAGGGVSTAGGGGFGGGGGAGALVIEWITPSSSETYAIGNGGTGVSGGTGNSGGNTTFGAYIMATGGSGGVANPGSGGEAAAGAGGAAGSTGDLNFTGATFKGVTHTGAGAGEGGGAARTTAGTGNAADANTGAGGGGGYSTDATARTGGAGGSGYIIVYEFA